MPWVAKGDPGTRRNSVFYVCEANQYGEVTEWAKCEQANTWRVSKETLEPEGIPFFTFAKRTNMER
ncbi:MAG TPA: hypothetical protein DCX32_03755 [Candidatus Moranbacteria bacterium]|nr:hypothetical protein [Candidatus Moranbacteria bacterium]